jgi:hypothetical protein
MTRNNGVTELDYGLYELQKIANHTGIIPEGRSIAKVREAKDISRKAQLRRKTALAQRSVQEETIAQIVRDAPIIAAAGGGGFQNESQICIACCR